MDLRFVLDEPTKVWYRAHCGEDQQVIVRVPGWDYNQLKERDAFDGANGVDKEFVGALDDGQDIYNKSHHPGEFIFYKLKFNQDPRTVLSAEIVNGNAGGDNNLELKIYTINVNHNRGKIVNCKDVYAVWFVAREDLKPRKKGKATDGAKEVSEAAALLQAMGFSTDDDDGDQNMGG